MSNRTFFKLAGRIYECRIHNGERQVAIMKEWMSVERFLERLSEDGLVEAAKLGRQIVEDSKRKDGCE